MYIYRDEVSSVVKVAMVHTYEANYSKEDYENPKLLLECL